MTSLNEINKIAIPVLDRTLILGVEEIVCFQYDGKCWNMYDTKGKRYTLATKIKSGDIKAYATSFISITQTEIINLWHLRSVENNTLRCELSTDTCPIDLVFSRTFYKKFCDMIFAG